MRFQLIVILAAQLSSTLCAQETTTSVTDTTTTSGISSADHATTSSPAAAIADSTSTAALPVGAPDATTTSASSAAAVPTPEPASTIAAVAEGTSVTLPSGLSYRDLVLGAGPETTTSQECLIHYTLTRDDGTTVESSRTRLVPVPFKVRPGSGQAIKGMEDGILGMRVGGRRHISVPPQLGYGEKGSAKIPPNATLHFDIEVVGAREPSPAPSREELGI